MSSIAMTHHANDVRIIVRESICFKHGSFRLRKILYLLLYQHVLLHLQNNVHCSESYSDNIINKINWSQLHYKPARSFNSPLIENQYGSSGSTHQQSPTTFSIEDLRPKPGLSPGMRDARVYPFPSKRSLPIDGDHGSTIAHENHRQHLPNGPPPFRPPMFASSAMSKSALEKLKQTLVFKRMYKPKVYYLFLDTLRQLTLLAEGLSRKKLAFAGFKYEALQKIINKLAWKSRDALKLKWPLILLNRQFLKEILSNPTFLVMLFHAVEVAYMSVPMNFWLKPLMRLIAQPSPEKEEQVWWRRKRLYDTLNGYGSSELQPNLKTVHFRYPGEPAPISIPNVVHIIRKLTNRPERNLNYNQHLDASSTKQSSNSLVTSPQIDFPGDYGHDMKDSQMTDEQQEAFLSNQVKNNQNHKENAAMTLIENETSDWPLEMVESGVVNHSIEPGSPLNQHQLTISPTNQEDWLSQLPSEDQLMSQHEFDSLDPKEKDMVLKEARQRFEESTWTNELIKEHNDLINSFTQGAQGLDDAGSSQLPITQTNTDLSEPPREEDTARSRRRH